MVIDIDSFATRIPSELFDEIPGHACPEQVSHEKMPAAMRCESFFQLISWIMQAHSLCMLFDNLLDTSPGDPFFDFLIGRVPVLQLYYGSFEPPTIYAKRLSSHYPGTERDWIAFS
jgi:hypothetical protein